MTREKLLSVILDNLNKPLVFVDKQHIIQYMNLPAKKRYSKYGDLIGKTIFECHNENSNKIIEDCFNKLKNGLEEIIYTNNQKHRIYMRSVLDENGTFLGYFERYEPPIGE